MRAAGDEQLLHIALINLLDNAFKFTRHTTNARVESAGRARENLSVQVRDNGAGFDPKYADRLFSPFQRLHAESEFPGAGLGLTTVQRVIHRHAGSISASGVLGRGASFSFTLPAAAEPGRHGRASGAMTTGEILLIEERVWTVVDSLLAGAPARSAQRRPSWERLGTRRQPDP